MYLDIDYGKRHSFDNLPPELKRWIEQDRKYRDATIGRVQREFINPLAERLYQMIRDGKYEL